MKFVKLSEKHRKDRRLPRAVTWAREVAEHRQSVDRSDEGPLMLTDVVACGAPDDLHARLKSRLGEPEMYVFDPDLNDGGTPEFLYFRPYGVDGFICLCREACGRTFRPGELVSAAEMHMMMKRLTALLVGSVRDVQAAPLPCSETLWSEHQGPEDHHPEDQYPAEECRADLCAGNGSADNACAADDYNVRDANAIAANPTALSSFFERLSRSPGFEVEGVDQFEDDGASICWLRERRARESGGAVHSSPQLLKLRDGGVPRRLQVGDRVSPDEIAGRLSALGAAVRATATAPGGAAAPPGQ